MMDTLFRHLSMVRLRVSLAMAIGLTMVGCIGEITTPGGDDAEDPAVTAARTAFEDEVMPILDGFCGACHTGMPNIDFMRPNPDIRTAMLEWPTLIDLVAPTSSSVLTQGAHTGPAFTPDQSSVVLEWIQLEVVAAGGEPAETVQSDRVTPVPGVNTIPLDSAGLSGSSLTFLYEPLATGMYLSDIQIIGGVGGVHAINPLFVIWEAELPNPDPINRFGNIDLTVLEGATSFVGGGTAVFVDVVPGSDISVEFRTLTTADGEGGDGGDGGVVGGGCNNVAVFTSTAQPPLAANCASCHGAGGMANAISATDMTQIAVLTADGQAAACAQIKTRTNELDPVNSGLFLAPDPGSGTAHPFKFPTAAAFQTFRTSVVNWITQESP